MSYNQIAKQAVDFQRTTFTNWYNAVAMIQEQSASAMEAIMSQSGLTLPETAHKAIKSWVNAYQEGFKRFHFYVESTFSSIEKSLVQGATTVLVESPKLLAEEKKAASAKSAKPVTIEKTPAPAQKTKLTAK